MRQVRYATNFQWTSGLYPVLKIGVNIIPRQTVEAYRGRIAFNTGGGNCWYLDSSFCQGWHELKR